MTTDNLQDKDYLGDSVYVGHDQYHIVLYLDNGLGSFNEIALEPNVLDALNRYRGRIFDKDAS